jgi:serine protease inhibitor
VATSMLLTGCTARGTPSTSDLYKGMQGTVDWQTEGQNFRDGYNQFSVELLQRAAAPGQNTLLSPLSVGMNLSMVAAGAKGQTREELLSLLGLEEGSPLLELGFGAWMAEVGQLPHGRLDVANSLWYREGEPFTLNQEYADRMIRQFGAQIEGADFSDPALPGKINRWVSDRTGGMIDKMVDEIPEIAVLYLLNALYFEEDWKTPYLAHQVGEDWFWREDGTGVQAEFLYDSGSFLYVENERAQGFVRPFADDRFVFLALLPTSTGPLQDYVEGLTAEELTQLWEGRKEGNVVTRIPTFSYGYEVELKEPLEALGVHSAFEMEEADLSGMGYSTDGALYLSKVKHKTFITLDAQGVRAGAATMSEVNSGGAMPELQIELDRPFVYAIWDTQLEVPILLGTVADPTGGKAGGEWLEGEIVQKPQDGQLVLKLAEPIEGVEQLVAQREESYFWPGEVQKGSRVRILYQGDPADGKVTLLGCQLLE